MANSSFRPTAIPLVTTDPFFSIWSFSDQLTDDPPRHWTGHEQSLYGLLFIDGVPFRFLGRTGNGEMYHAEPQSLRQARVRITPTSTVYTFVHKACEFRVTFLTPLLLDRPEIFSRPVSYVFYEITPKEEGHTFSVYFDACASIAGSADRVKTYDCFAEKGHVWVGNTEQNPLNSSGDDHRIDWGYLHLVHPNAQLGILYHRIAHFSKRVSLRRSAVDFSVPVPTEKMPILSAQSEKLSDVFILAYDDTHSIQYFGKNADVYCNSVYGSFEKMLQTAVSETAELRSQCAAFDRKLLSEMKKISPDYANVGALTYRQAVAAHKLVSIGGKLYFFSKENYSNGCIATLDVTYPSIPLFLRFNPELVRAMMRPILEYARMPEWEFPFAPHDVGTYPLANGQKYSRIDGKLVIDKQMPVEECGNAILCVAAAQAWDGDRSFADENRDLLTRWAEYLAENGYDPANQLCTDDFAGRFARNCNLSMKAIVALGAYGKLYGDPAYTDLARRMAADWVKDAKREGAGSRLTFDQPASWSLKYNLVWDKLLGLGLFDESVGRQEIAVYREKMNAYGVPLDNRADFTKLDWLAWTTVLADDPAYTKSVFAAIAKMVQETPERVPVTDWYDTVDAHQIGFQARSVVGGFFIKLL